MKLLIAKNTADEKIVIPYQHIVTIEESSTSLTKIVTTGGKYYFLKGSFEDYVKLLYSNLV